MFNYGQLRGTPLFVEFVEAFESMHSIWSSQARDRGDTVGMVSPEALCRAAAEHAHHFGRSRCKQCHVGCTRFGLQNVGGRYPAPAAYEEDPF